MNPDTLPNLAGIGGLLAFVLLLMVNRCTSIDFTRDALESHREAPGEGEEWKHR